jgi:hypothetical protein
MPGTFMHVFRRQVTVPRQGTRSSCRAYLTIVRRGNGNGVLPKVRDIFFGGFQSSCPLEDAISQFVAARQLCALPVTVHCRQRKTYGVYRLEVDG